MAAINKAETPIPTIILEVMAIVKFGDKPNDIAPKEAMKPDSTITFRGPHLSDRIPTGTCIMPYE